jgi:hypothetical protein
VLPSVISARMAKELLDNDEVKRLAAAVVPYEGAMLGGRGLKWAAGEEFVRRLRELLATGLTAHQTYLLGQLIHAAAAAGGVKAGG